jgi:23S rRNA G2445 N2-methylase RlmL
MSKILVTCAKKVNLVLESEIKGLGLPVLASSDLGVMTEGTIEDTMRLNMYLRTGHRVLFMLKEFRAANPDHLYNELNSIPWENFLDVDGYVSIVSFVLNESILDTRFANLKTKDAIVDRFQSIFGRRPDSGPDRDKAVVYLYWKESECAIYLDTSGETIAKHGYRKIPYKAPLMEALAAALILATKWDKKSNFINPMCGSGTLAIEAAMMATNRAPGLYRDNFGFMHLKEYDESKWKNIVHEAKKKITDNINFQIIANDLEEGALEAAEINSKLAGVQNLIKYEQGDFTQTTIPDGGGVVLINPEYGERLGEEEDLEVVYSTIGDFFKQKCQGYTGYIFTGNMNLAKKVGLKTKRKMEFYNSKIECRLLEYELYQGTKKHIYPQA